MSQYRCLNCQITFEDSSRKPRCPQCLRQYGLEDVGSPSLLKHNKQRIRRRFGPSFLALSLVVFVAAGASLIFRRYTDLPQPGQLAILSGDVLKNTLVKRGIPWNEAFNPFVSSAAMLDFVKEMQGNNPAEQANKLLQKLARLMSKIRPDVSVDEPTIVRTPEELWSVIQKKTILSSNSLEMALLVATLMRILDISAIVAQCHHLQTNMSSADLPSGIGRYLVVIYKKEALGKEPLLILDPFRSLNLPRWCGEGNDSTMRSLTEHFVPLDDATVAAHVMALRAFQQRNHSPDKAYALSQLALKAGASSPNLYLLQASILASVGGTADAIAAGRKALSMDAESAVHTALAELMLLSGNINEAKTHLEKALQDDGQYWPAHQALATLLFATDVEQSKKHLQAALDIAPDEPSNLMLQAAQELRDSRPQHAIPLLKKSLAQRSALEGELLLYQAFLHTGDELAAKQQRQKLLAKAKDRNKIEQLLDTMDNMNNLHGVSESSPPSKNNKGKE